MDIAIHFGWRSIVAEKASSRHKDVALDRNQKTVRLQEVAAAAGVSLITASRCISNPERVSKRTRERVLKIAAQLGYIPNRLASGLVSARTMVVGVIVPTIANPIHGVVIQGLTDVLEPAGYKILLGTSHYSRETEFDLVRTFVGYRVDGVMLTGYDHSEACIELLKRSGNPIVEMLGYNPNPLDVGVGSPNAEAGATLAEYVIARGKKNLAFVSHAGLDDRRVLSRLQGIRAACIAAGVPEPLYYESPSEPGTGEGGEIVSTILRESPHVDAVIFAGHQIAVGAIRHAVGLNIAVPGRVAIAAFGDSPIAQWLSPSLTTMWFPLRETGVESGRLMLQRLAGKEPTTRAVRLGYELLRRESA